MKNFPIRSTKEFTEILQKNNELLFIDEEVDPKLELAEIQRRVVSKKGPAILFTNVKGTKFSVATNLYGSEKRIRIAFGNRPIELIKKLADTAQNMMPPNFRKIWEARSLAFEALKVGLKKVHSPLVLGKSIFPVDNFQLPQLKSWPKDGGAFITLPLVYTESPLTGKSNLGMYRIQFHDSNTTGMHIQIHRGGGFHYFESEKLNKPLPAHIYVGGPPALTLAAIAPMPEDLSELIIASLLLGERLKMYRNKNISPLPIVADADFVILGEIPPKERKPEGPFGDHYGYYALKHDYPILKVRSIYHRKDAIWPATVVGRPPQEDHFIAEFLQELLSPMFPLVMPKLESVWAFEESGVHTLAGAIVKERYPKEAFTAALRILGEGHLSLTKCLFVTDCKVELKNFKKFFTIILERINPNTDIYILSNISQDTLDYTGPGVNQGSKMILLGLGEKKNSLKKSITGHLKCSLFSNPRIFIDGALVISGKKYKKGDRLPEKLLSEKIVQGFLFVFLVDDSIDAVRSEHDFIWTVFTRFEPAGDLYGKYNVVRNHISFSAPVIFDCRMKDWYPPVLEPDKKVQKKVDEKFGKIIDNL
ncbi:MAG: UbiD family decarboxylase [Leptospiraceae bacterium]|nr:UbiD family decarboxylase [Leptospiraceae bacterium]MCK6382017.1 UbiD family decarboxylase [Leptospiraceae bacterium]NUM40388.1 UbiD family decarboxylase [Leptospiraceae bacterium]